MDESKRDPREDISLIRQILERATDGMKSVAPWFRGFGLLWLLYGAFSAALRLLLPRLSPAAAGRLSTANALVGWLFFTALALGFFACRRQQRRLGLETLARKLVDLWGVCIVSFLVLMLLTSALIPFLAARGPAFSAQSAQALNLALALCRGFLFFLLAAPLLITAVVLENRRMLWAGIGISALAALVLSCHALMLYADGAAMGAGWALFWNAATCLLDLAPGVMLLIFARQLKRA